MRRPTDLDREAKAFLDALARFAHGSMPSQRSALRVHPDRPGFRSSDTWPTRSELSSPETTGFIRAHAGNVLAGTAPATFRNRSSRLLART